jgi:hypothetical protein
MFFIHHLYHTLVQKIRTSKLSLHFLDKSNKAKDTVIFISTEKQAPTNGVTFLSVNLHKDS